jgi:hypothetical protein
MRRIPNYLLLVLFIFLGLLQLSGCDGFTPSGPNDEYNKQNTELDHIKVLPAQAEMNVNQSKKFEVKAYNSDDKLIALDSTQIKWSARYTLCYACIDFKLSPIEGSVQTTFTPTNPDKPGKYEVWAKFEGTEVKWAKANVEVN